jgi:ubiquitin
MSMLLERTTPNVSQQAAEMSVDTRSFDFEREVKMMTATTDIRRLIDAPAGRRARPHGLDRLVMRLGMAMLISARKHAERDVLSYEQHTLRLDQRRAAELRDREDALRAARIR